MKTVWDLKISRGRALIANAISSRRAGLLYWLLVAFLFAAGAFQRFSLPATPFGDPDTWGYLHPSLSALTKGIFVHTNHRAFVYPLFVYGILRFFGDFVYISIAQHLIGLLAGIFLLMTWHGLFSSLPDSLFIRKLHRILGLVVLTIFLLSKTSLLMEHSIRPESVFPFFAILCIWLALQYWRAFQDRRLLSVFFWGIALIYDAVLLYFIKPSWGIGALFALAPLLLSLFLLKRHLSYKVLLLLLPAVLIFVTLWLPERRLVKLYDPGSDRSLPDFLLAVHADIIRDEMAQDLAGSSLPAMQRPLLEKVVGLIDLEIERSRGKYVEMTINQDALFENDDSACGLIRQFFGEDTAAYKRFCLSYYERAWLHQPWRMLKKVLRQLRGFYSWENQGYDASIRATISTAKTAVRSSQALDYLPQACPPAYERYRATSLSLEQSHEEWRQAIPISLLNMALYVCYPFVVAASLLVCGVVLCGVWRKVEPARTLLPLSLWTLYVHSYNFGNCLTIAIVHTIQVGRYAKNQLIYTVLSECCGILLIVAAVGVWRAHSQGRQGSGSISSLSERPGS